MVWRPALLAVLLAAPASAQTLRCVAEQQCRGDAQAMCAPSGMEIRLELQGPRRAHLWIAGSGPYRAELQPAEDGDFWALSAFGGAHRLELGAEGRFRYIGNRGKRYTGRCEEG